MFRRGYSAVPVHGLSTDVRRRRNMTVFGGVDEVLVGEMTQRNQVAAAASVCH